MVSKTIRIYPSEAKHGINHKIYVETHLENLMVGINAKKYVFLFSFVFSLDKLILLELWI